MVSRSNSTCSEKRNLVSLVNTQLIEKMSLQFTRRRKYSARRVNIEEVLNPLNSKVNKEHLEEKFYQVETDITLEALKKEQDFNYSKYKVLAKNLNHLKCY